MYASEVAGLADLPGNPYRAEVHRFGNAIVVICGELPGSSLYNRILCAGPDDLADLERAVAYMRSRSVRPRVDISPLHQSSAFMQRLSDWGLVPLGFEAVLYADARSLCTQPPPPGVTVRAVQTPEEIETAAKIVAQAFGSTGRTADLNHDLVRVSVANPSHRVYLGLVDGEPAGAAALHVEDGVASLEVAGTLPEFRGKGLQSALIHRRIADGVALGCDLVTTQTASGSRSEQNMERAGLRIAYTKAEYFGAP